MIYHIPFVHVSKGPSSCSSYYSVGRRTISDLSVIVYLTTRNDKKINGNQINRLTDSYPESQENFVVKFIMCENK